MLTAEEIISRLQLAPHPCEGGYFRETYRSALTVPAGALPEHFKIEGMPSSVLIGPDGKVLHQHAGFRSHQTAEYEAAIRAALPREEARQ